MASEQAEEDPTSKNVLAQLSGTCYACSSLTPLASRPANFVYRGILAAPLTTPDGDVASSIIIKYCTDPVNVARSTFDEFLLRAAVKFSAPGLPSSTAIKIHRLYHFDQEENIQILQDFPDTVGFKATLFSPNADDLLPPPSPATIGRHLGSWLRAFHAWASAPEQAGLRARMLQDDPMRKMKYRITYGSFIEKLGNFPELLEGHDSTLRAIQEAMAKEFERSPAEADENFGLIHADLWSGNILLPDKQWRDPPPPGETNQLFVIDWEYAQCGHRALDLGQLVGDLMERKLFNDADTSMPVLRGILDGYGEVSEEMAFRTALHIGVHIIGWWNRRPKRGPWVTSPEAAKAGLAAGRDILLKAWARDRGYFEGGVLAPLFSANLN